MNTAVMNMAPAPQFSLRLGPWLAGAVAWLLMLGLGWWFMNVGDSREITSLRIEGDFQRVSAHAVEAVIRNRLDQGFVELQLEQVKTDAESLPWVARARVERTWPAGVRVRIWEREAYARWSENALLDTEGRVFVPAPDEFPAQLPRLGGEKGHEREVMEAYQRLSAQLADTPFALEGLALNVRGEWTAQTHARIGLRLGPSATQDKLELLRGPVSRALQQRMEEVDYVDLRYTNGFAVGWKQRPAASTGETHG